MFFCRNEMVILDPDDKNIFNVNGVRFKEHHILLSCFPHTCLSKSTMFRIRINLKSLNFSNESNGWVMEKDERERKRM